MLFDEFKFCVNLSAISTNFTNIIFSTLEIDFCLYTGVIHLEKQSVLSFLAVNLIFIF